MSGNVLILLELLLVFGLVFGWGLNELRQLRKHKDKSAQSSPEVRLRKVGEEKRREHAERNAQAVSESNQGSEGE